MAAQLKPTNESTADAASSKRARPLGDLARDVTRRTQEGSAEIQDTALEAMNAMWRLNLTPEQREALTPAYEAASTIVSIAGGISQMSTYLLADKPQETNRAIDNFDGSKKKRSGT